MVREVLIDDRNREMMAGEVREVEWLKASEHGNGL